MSENLAKYNVILELLANTKGVDEVEKKVGGLQKTFNIAKGAFAGIIAANIVQGGISLISGLVSKSIELSSAYEQTKVAFDTFLGDSEKATQVLSELNKFSIETPFEPDQVNQAAKSLLAFGLSSDQLIPKLTQIGDISSATGKDFNELAVIFGKAKVAGTLFAEDINQLTEAGIPVIQEFAKQLGVSEGQVKKLASEGKISFKNLEEAFTSLTTEGGKFQGLMLAQSQTFGGLVSSLKGIFDELIRGFGDAFLPIIKSLLIPLTNGLFTLMDAFKRVQPVVTGFFKGLFTFYGNTISPLVDALKRLATTLFGAGDGFKFLQVVINGLSGAFRIAIQGVTFLVESLTTVIKFLQTSDLPFITTLRAGFGFLLETFQNIGPIIAGVVAFVKQDFLNLFDFFTLTYLQSKKLINDFQAFLGSDSAKAESNRLKREIDSIKANRKTAAQAYKEAFDNEVKNRIQIEELEKKAATKRDLKTNEEQKKADQNAGKDKKKTQEQINKELLDIELEKVNKEFALREKAARETIGDAKKLGEELEKLEVQKQIALATIKQNFAKKDSAEFFEIGNQIDELSRKYNSLIRVKSEPLDFLPTAEKDIIVKNAKEMEAALIRLSSQILATNDPKLKVKLEKQFKELQDGIDKIGSPKLNKLTFETGGFDAIDLDKLLPDDRVPALQNRLGLVTGAVEQMKAKLQAGLGDPLDLEAFDSLRDEGEKIIELLQRLGIEIPAMSEKIIKGTGDILGISPETLQLVNESVEVARDAFSTISDIYIGELDKRIEAQQSRVKDAEKIAEKGNVKQLELEEERLAKLEEKREEAIKRQSIIDKIAAQAQIIVNTALTISNLQVAAAKAGAITGGIGAPIVFAIVGGLIASAANLVKPPAFIEGIEQVDQDPRFAKYRKHSGQDGYTARFDGKERIVDPITNSKLNGFPNALLPDAVKLYQMQSTTVPKIIAIGGKSDDTMIKEIQALRESFENTRTSITLDKKGLAIQIDKMIQKNIQRKRFTA